MLRVLAKGFVDFYDPDGAAPPEGEGAGDELRLLRRTDGSLVFTGRLADPMDAEMAVEVRGPRRPPALPLPPPTHPPRPLDHHPGADRHPTTLDRPPPETHPQHRLQTQTPALKTGTRTHPHQTGPRN